MDSITEKEKRKIKYEKNKETILARCKIYRDSHKEQRQQYQRQWYLNNQDKEKERSKTLQKEIRLEVLSHYGGKCVFCGDTNINHLSVDHINNDGAKHRKSMGHGGGGSRIYRWLKKNGFPSGFQILCHTHNSEKGYYGTMTPAEYG